MPELKEKECRECGDVKSIDNFYVDSAKPDGYKYRCSECLLRKDSNEQWLRILGNIEIKWVDGELLMERLNAKFCTGCGELKSADEYYPQEGGQLGVQSLCPDCDFKRGRKHYYENIEHYKEYAKEYKNRPEVKERIRKRKKERYYNDPSYRIKDCITSTMNEALRENKKSAKTEELLGCTVDECRKYIEDQWKEGMSWDNYGRGSDCWHIDHEIPCSLFDFTDEKQQYVCFHWSNLQPLWEADNIRKHNNIRIFDRIKIGNNFLEGIYATT